MGYRSNVAFSFDEHNWKSLCERAKTNKNALSEHNSFNDMLKYADINREVEFLEIKFHVLEWNNIEWYSSYDEDAIKFFNDEGKKLCDEFIRIGEEPDDVDFINGHNLLWIDGDDIHIMGVTLLNYDRKQILKDLAQLLLRADPFAVKGYQEAHKSYECDEFTDLFKFKETSKS